MVTRQCYWAGLTGFGRAAEKVGFGAGRCVQQGGCDVAVRNVLTCAKMPTGQLLTPGDDWVGWVVRLAVDCWARQGFGRLIHPSVGLSQKCRSRKVSGTVFVAEERVRDPAVQGQLAGRQRLSRCGRQGDGLRTCSTGPDRPDRHRDQPGAARSL